MSLSIDSRDAPPTNVAGNSISITLFTVLKRWWGRPYMEGLLRLPRHARKTMLGKMDGLEFISFASWNVITRLPHNGPQQRVRELKRPHLFFDVHFNGGWDQYVESSVRVLNSGMKLFWGSSRTYPGPLPARRFLQFFRDHEVHCAHYYCAYPEATVKVVRHALELEVKLGELVEQARGLDASEFDDAWRRFLGEAQRLL
jgi:hypothetical protein